MAFRHGKDAVFKLATAGAPTVVGDISAYLTSVGFPQEVETAEVTTLGDADKEYIVGLRDKTVSIEGKFDPTIDAQLNALYGFATPVAFEFHPQGTAATLPKYTQAGTTVGLLLTSYEVTEDIGAEGTFSAEFQSSGAVTRGTN